MQDYDPGNVAVADMFSNGCAEHADPACLCDVDLSRGRCPEPNMALRNGYDGGDVFTWATDRLAHAERCWMMEKFGGDAIENMHHLYRHRRFTEYNDSGVMVNASEVGLQPYQVVELVARSFGGSSAAEAAESMGVARGAAMRALTFFGKNANDILHDYAIWLFERHKGNGVSRRTIWRYLRTYRPELYESTVYRWFYDYEHGSRGAKLIRGRARKAAA